VAASRTACYYWLACARERMRMQEQRRTAVEEKLRVLQASRDELQTYAKQQSGLVGELQSRNSQLTIDNESLRRRLADLQQVSHRFTSNTYVYSHKMQTQRIRDKQQ